MQAPKRKGSGSQALATTKRARFWDDVLDPSPSEVAPTSPGLSMVSGVHTANISGGAFAMVERDNSNRGRSEDEIAPTASECTPTLVSTSALISNVHTAQIHGGAFHVSGPGSVNTTIHNHHYGTAAAADSDIILEILRSLPLPNFRDTQLDTLAKAIDGTCLWMTTGELYLFWITKGKILWGIGIPGAGKTVLASIVIRDLLRREEASGGAICVAFVYLRYSEPLTLRDILESLVKQIVEYHTDLIPLISKIYMKHKRDQTRPTQQELMALLTEFSRSSKTLFFFLDALDELREADRPVLLKFLASLNAKLFITSRPLASLQKQYPEARMFDIAADPSDVKLLVHDTLRRSPDLMTLLDGTGLEDEIMEKICQKAGGMFLHARLQLEALRHCINIQGVEDTLEGFSAEIEEVYAKTWERILAQPAEQANVAKLVFVWILCAKRELTIDRLRHLVSTCPQTYVYQAKRLVPEALLVSLCCGLVSVDPKTRRVRLIHYTTKDAIIPHIQKLYPYPHAIPTFVCLTHLSCSGFQNMEAEEFSLYYLFKEDPLLEYAYSFWDYHARQCAQDKSAAEAVADFVSQCSAYPWTHPQEVMHDLLGPLHVAALKGFDNLITKLGLSHSPNACTPGYQATPFAVACWYGRYSSVKALLSLPGTDVNVADVCGWTPLKCAICKADVEFVEKLLEVEGIDVNASNSFCGTALTLACEWNDTEMTKLLLNTPSVDINATDDQGATPLMYASYHGHTEIVELLLETTGIKPHVTAKHSHFGEGSALTYASKKGRTEIIKLLEALVPTLASC